MGFNVKWLDFFPLSSLSMTIHHVHYFIVKSLLTIIVLSCHDIHIFWSLFPLFGGYSVIYIIFYDYYIIIYYIYHYSELFSCLHFVIMIFLWDDHSSGRLCRIVGGSCANWKNALLLGSLRVAVALGSSICWSGRSPEGSWMYITCCTSG